MFREVEDESPFATPKQQVEHEAYLSLLAQRAGVRVPSLRLAAPADQGYVMLVEEWVAGRSLGSLDPVRVDDSLLRSVWSEVAKLHRAGIAHRDLRLANVLVDAEGLPWFVDFGYAQAAASDRRRGQDVAELLGSLACMVGAPRAVRAASEMLDVAELAAALPLLQPLALSVTTRAALRRRRGLLEDLRGVVAEAAGVTPTEPPPVTRVRPATLATLAVGAFAVHTVLPQVANVSSILRAMAAVDWPDVALAGALIALSYATAALALVASSPRALAFGRTIAVHVASSFLNRLAPGGLGALATHERYLERAGLGRRTAMSVVSLVTATSVVAHAVLLVMAGAAVAATRGLQERLPEQWPVLFLLVVALVALGLALRRPLGRRNVTTRLRLAAGALPPLIHRPGRAALLALGTAATTACHLGALAVVCRGIGVDLPFASLALAYLASTAIASASPTPGGLGAVETALVVALTGLGGPVAPVIAAVLVFRLVSYWLPMVPGLLVLRALQRAQVL